MAELAELKKKLQQVRSKAIKENRPDVIERAERGLRQKFPNALQEDRSVVKNVTQKINTKQANKTITGSAFRKKIAKLVGKKALSSIPIIGGIASAFMSGDASAAIPILGGIEGAGGPDQLAFEARMHREHAEFERKRKAKKRGK